MQSEQLNTQTSFILSFLDEKENNQRKICLKKLFKTLNAKTLTIVALQPIQFSRHKKCPTFRPGIRTSKLTVNL